MIYKANHQNPIDFYAFLKLIPPGTMVCDLFEFSKSKPEAAFLIKENPERLESLGQQVHIEMRSSVLKADQVFLIPWSIEDFERAQWRQARKYPTTIALWHSLKEDGNNPF